MKTFTILRAMIISSTLLTGAAIGFAFRSSNITKERRALAELEAKIRADMKIAEIAHHGEIEEVKKMAAITIDNGFIEAARAVEKLSNKFSHSSHCQNNALDIAQNAYEQLETNMDRLERNRLAIDRALHESDNK